MLVEADIKLTSPLIGAPSLSLRSLTSSGASAASITFLFHARSRRQWRRNASVSNGHVAVPVASIIKRLQAHFILPGYGDRHIHFSPGTREMIHFSIPHLKRTATRRLSARPPLSFHWRGAATTSLQRCCLMLESSDESPGDDAGKYAK